MQAPHSGFQRLQAGQSLVLVDTGKPPPHGFDEEAHAGTLSFELSQGRERIIVNCGGYRGDKPGVAAGRAVERGAFGAGRRRHQLGRDPRRRLARPRRRTRSAASAPRRAAINGSPPAMTAIAALRRDLRARTVSRRRWRRSARRGQADRRARARRSRCAFTCTRRSKPSLVEDGGGARLRLPSGAVWRLRAAGAEMSLGESIYLGTGRAPKNPADRAERHDRPERRHGALGDAPRAEAARQGSQGR